MSELESINKIDFSPENIPRIFESQRKNLKQDILFLKEDILKDFREIEIKLNTKYEKQNSNTLTKLHKFENTIEAMNNKIFELSTLISTDKNIQQKVANLQDFKEKVSDKLVSQEIAIKTNESVMKDSINKYDKIISESVIYPGVIGGTGRFQTFHQLIDYLLLNITQFINFKDKNMIDFKGYKTKLESLFKSLKAQTDSIVTSTNKYTNKRILDSEKIIKQLINNNESKIYDIKLENNKFNSYIEGKIDEKYNEIKRLVEIRTDLCSKIEEEIDLLKDFNKGVSIKFENNENEINIIKDKFKIFSESIEEMQFLSKKDSNILDFMKNSKIKNNNNINNNKFFNINNSYNINNSNHNRFSRRGTLAKSIIKQYISGEIGLNELENPIKRQKSTLINENEIINIINSNSDKYKSKYKSNYSLDNISRGKRLTLSPDKFRSILDKNLLNKFMEINSEKTILDRSINSISEEKSEDNENIYSFRDNSNDKKINVDKNNNLLKEEINNDDKMVNKDKNREGDKIILLKNENKSEINSSAQTEIINIKKSDINAKEKENNSNYLINENNDYHSLNSKGSFKSISYEKKILDNNKNFKKVGKYKKRKEYRINNQKQMSTIGKLCQIGGVQDIINYSKSNTNRLNKTSIIFYDNNNIKDNKKNKFYYYNIKKENRQNKLNIIEVNFDKPKESFNEDNELKNIIKKIKENRINFFSERNNRPLDKNKTFKKFQMSDSDLGFENSSLKEAHLNSNLKSPNSYKIMNNDEFGKYSSFGYLNYIKNNKKILNMRKMNLSKKKELFENLSN